MILFIILRMRSSFKVGIFHLQHHIRHLKTQARTVSNFRFWIGVLSLFFFFFNLPAKNESFFQMKHILINLHRSWKKSVIYVSRYMLESNTSLSWGFWHGCSVNILNGAGVYDCIKYFPMKFPGGFLCLNIFNKMELHILEP